MYTPHTHTHTHIHLPYRVIIFCTSELWLFYSLPRGNRWADTGPSNGWENNCHKVNFIACSMHLWAGGRCPLPGSWWMVGPLGQEWKWEGRGQARGARVLPLPPEIEIFLTCPELVFWYIREEMFHLVWWWKPSCVPVNCVLRHRLCLIHPRKVNIHTS